MLETTLKAHQQSPTHPGWSNIESLVADHLLSHEGWIAERDAESVQVILWLCSGCWCKARIFKCFQDYTSLAAGSDSFWAPAKVVNVIGNDLQLLQNIILEWKVLWALCSGRYFVVIRLISVLFLQKCIAYSCPGLCNDRNSCIPWRLSKASFKESQETKQQIIAHPADVEDRVSCWLTMGFLLLTPLEWVFTKAPNSPN